MELYLTTQSDASKDKPSHHTGEIPICRYDDDRDEKQVFHRKRQDEPAVYSCRLRQGPRRRLAELTRRSDQKDIQISSYPFDSRIACAPPRI